MKTYWLGFWAGLFGGLATAPIYLVMYWTGLIGRNVLELEARGILGVSERSWLATAYGIILHPILWAFLGMALMVVANRNIVAWSGVALGVLWFLGFWGWWAPVFTGVPSLWTLGWPQILYEALPSILAGGITGFIAGVFGPTPVH